MPAPTFAPLAGNTILPVLIIDHADHAEELAHALLEGGISCAEVTLRTPAALGAIARMAEVPGFAVAAGTVLSPEQADAVADAGARFIVSPGFDERVLDRARTRGLGVLPGVATATEIMRAGAADVNVVKFFPAAALGGVEAIRALAGPFPTTGFVPSGGITAGNSGSYLADPNVSAVCGSWMAPREFISSQDYATITRLSGEAVRGAQ